MATMPTKSPDPRTQVPGVGVTRRTSGSGVQKIMRAFNRRILNPPMLRFAGRRGFYAAVVQHTGRRSGRRYVTPVVAAPSGTGFIIALPYGADTDWCRNVLAAGGCTLQHRGVMYQVGAPRIVGASEALPAFSPVKQRAFRLARIRQYLQLQRLPDAATRPEETDA
jgi:deazaflavin-dependent oxidoreductase (nitroreductase family)